MITLSDLIAQNEANLGDQTGVCCGELTLTWKQVGERVRRLAGALRALGLQRGDRVAMIGGNSPEFFDFYFAVPAAGAIAVPINMRLAAAEVADVLADCRARVLIVEPQFVEFVSGIRAGLADVAHFLVAGGETSAGFRRVDSLPVLQGEQGEQGERGSIDDVAMLIYTGGTTGRPKGVMLTHHGLITNALQWAAATDLTRHEGLLIAAPMFHASGTFNCILGTLLGYPIYILPRFDPVLFFDTVQRHRATNTAVVPTMIEMLATHPDIAKYDLSSLRSIAYGGSPMPMRTLKLGMAALPQARFYQLYGQTECGPVVTVLHPEDHTEEGSRIRSAGRTMPATLITILDPAGHTLPAGETGEICVRCPAVSPGYWQQPELSAETHRGGWHHTGDAGYLDKDNFLFVVDRIKDMIVTGGENVYAAEVEKALTTHPAVEGCAVIGIPHQRLVEQVHAIVRVKAGAAVEEAELIAHCRNTLAGYKCPQSVEFRLEQFPLTAIGKVLKRDLRKEYAERHKPKFLC
jgi:long-chain acyl-CoA synthetase